MTNTELLKRLIAKRGIKYQHICTVLNLSYQGFKNKIENVSEFKASEIEKLCELLSITTLKDKEEIFFARL